MGAARRCFGGARSAKRPVSVRAFRRIRQFGTHPDANGERRRELREREHDNERGEDAPLLEDPNAPCVEDLDGRRDCGARGRQLRPRREGRLRTGTVADADSRERPARLDEVRLPSPPRTQHVPA